MRILDVILRIIGSYLRVLSKRGLRFELRVNYIILVIVLNMVG